MLIYIFIDESGDLGFDFHKPGTSRYFVIAALVINGHQERKLIERAVRRTLSHKINIGKTEPASELKARKHTLKEKKYFWKQVQDVPFTLYAVVLDKEQVPAAVQRQGKAIYNILADTLVANIPVEAAVESLHVEIDRSQSSTARAALNRQIADSIRQEYGDKLRLSIYQMDSEESKAIQAIDMFSWGIFRKHERQDTDWYTFFADRIGFELVLKLDKLKP